VNQFRWLIRAKQLVRHPPSAGRVKLVLGVVAVCILLVAVEKFIGWPDWLTVDRMGFKP